MEHPVGIEPWGNYYMCGGGPNIRDEGLGALSVLSDALMLEVLGCGLLRGPDLGRLALVSRSLYCFATLEELWKDMVIEELGGRFTWAGCWQRTYLVSTGLLPPAAAKARVGRDGKPVGEDEADVEDKEEEGDEEEEEAEGKGEEKEPAPVANGQEQERARKRRQGKRQKRVKAAAGGSDAAVEKKAGCVEGGLEEGRRSKRLKGSDVAAAAAVGPKGKKGNKGDKRGSPGPREPAVFDTHNVAAADNSQEKRTDQGKGSGKGKQAADRKCMASCDGNGTASAEDEEEAAEGPGPGSTAAAAAAASQPGHCEQRRHGRCRQLLRRVPGGGPQRYLRVRGFYSDLLFQPWFCATVEPPADWLEVDNIDRRSGLTHEQFRREYDIPNRPVILMDVMSKWPAMRKWSVEYFRRVLGSKDVIVGNMPMPFSTYMSYCSSNHDEMPLYLFDKHFTATAPSLASDYVAPAQFGEDLFGLLGEGGRPDYRWLIQGPARSGSSFHVDPNATSAWNALVWGAKKWVMYPPGTVPPGVHPSPDGADVATPLSLTEWFVNFYAATKETKVRPVEFIARPGELLFVPRGWWHCALNLEESCAITQNFVSEVGLAATLAFLKSRRPEMVSGCALENRCSLYDRFVAALREKRPGVLAAVEARQEEARAKAREANRLAALFKLPTTAPQPQHKANGGGATSPAGEGRSYTSEGAAGDPAGGGGGCGSGSGGFSFGFSFGGGVGSGGGAATDSCNGGGAAGGGFKFGFGL